MRTRTRRVLIFVLGMIAAWTLTVLIVVGLIIQPGPVPRPGLPAIDNSFPAQVVRALIAGTSAGLLASLLEIKVFPRFGRRFSAGVVLAFRSLVYAGVAWVSVLTVARFVARRQLHINLRDLLGSEGWREFVTSPDFGQMIMALVVASFLINGVVQVNRLLGPGVALQMLAGKYLRPRSETRIFLFIDLTGSTRIAEELGPLRFSEFRNAFFQDLAEPVLDTGGQIVQYVGDEAVITWTVERGLADANCLRCFFLIEARLNELHARYHERFGEVPRFKAAVHVGEVVVAEIGDIKREISYSGDTMNTTARVEALCRVLGRRFLVSSELMERLHLPDEYQAEDLGEQELRGRRRGLRVFSVTRAGSFPSTGPRGGPGSLRRANRSASSGEQPPDLRDQEAHDEPHG